MDKLKRMENENELEFIWRLGELKTSGALDITWETIADIVNNECREEWEDPRGESAYRKQYQAGKLFYDQVFKKLTQYDYSTEQEKLDEIFKAKKQFYDQRRVYNKQLTEDARAEHLTKELIKAANALPSLAKPEHGMISRVADDNSAVLCFSDWHYGQVSQNVWNVYDTEIFIERLSKLITKTKRYLQRHKPHTLHIVILGDIIEGSLRPLSQVEASELVCEQIMNVSEYIAQAVSDLAVEVPSVKVYSTYGNHARTVQNYVDSVHADNSERLISWWLEQRLKDVSNVTFMPNYHEFLRIDVEGQVIAATHGDLDKVRQLSTVSAAVFNKYFGVIPNYVVMGHVHHSSSFDDMGIETITVGSMCGTDSYANSKRLFATPAQTLMFFNAEEGLEARYDIKFQD